MNRYYDSQNYIQDSDSAVDPLRAEIGKYFSLNSATQKRWPTSFANNKISGFALTAPEIDTQVLFPTKKQRIYFYGNEESFRDQIQWNTYVKKTITEETTFVDHNHLRDQSSIINKFNHSYHSPEYEDLTKIYDTNLLASHTMLNYKRNDTLPSVRDMAVLRTEYDASSYVVKSADQAKRLLNQYPGRLLSYTGSINSMIDKQRNIFILSKDTTVNDNNGIDPAVTYPFYYSLDLSTPQLGLAFKQTMEQYDIDKFIFKFISENLASQRVNFHVGEEQVPIKAHNVSDLLLINDMSNFVETDRQLFLFREADLLSTHLSNRFVNRLNIIRFFSKYREMLTNSLKDVHDIFDCHSHDQYFVGYKIEKFLDRESTTPIQTYYINKHDYKFIDTQLKYGRKYVYKISLLVAVAGSSYKYSNLTISQEGGDLLRSDGTIVTEYGGDVSKKYKAYADITVSPSLQILEVFLETYETMFYDQPTLPPELFFYNQSGNNTLEVILRPNLTEKYDANYSFKRLTDSDEHVEENLALSKDNVYNTVFTSTYFTGIYEIYRMDHPPTNIEDFANNFLTEVDMDAKVIYQGRDANQQATPSTTTSNIKVINHNNQIAHFEDTIVPNKKYYYLFRTKTYHGTPSNYTNIYEVEILSDSDGSKLSVEEYKIKPKKPHTYRRSCKRIFKIAPNGEHLFFRGTETDIASALQSIGLLDNKLMGNTQGGRTFKIRITSKHTGKKMDINLTVKLVDKTNQ